MPALRERFEVVEDGVPALRIHAHGGLVEQQNLRIVQQRGGHVQAALHAAAEAVDLVLGPVGQAHQLEHAPHGPLQLGAAQIIERAEQRQVVARGELLVQPDILGRQADLPLQRVGVAVKPPPADQDFARIRAQQPRDYGNGGGLSGAIGAQQPDDFAFAGAQAHAIHGHQRAEALPECFNFQHDDAPRRFR